MGLWEMIKGEQPGPIKSLLNYENAGQFGEFSTEFALTNDNLPGELIVLKNVYIPHEETTAEIDLLMLHEKGIFVFESKNYSGWIFGSASQLNWTQSLQNGDKNRFYNPIRQNQTHIKALAEFLEMPESEFTSCIVFSERCTLKKVPEDTEQVWILRRPNLLKKLRGVFKTASTKYSHGELTKMADRLRNLTNQPDGVKEKHIEDIRTKCPFCGSELILREGKYGRFWGCSAYPKCRFTRQEK